jgi:hypothetical protein
VKKIFSIGLANSRAMAKASGRLGSYLPVSIVDGLARHFELVRQVALAPATLRAQFADVVFQK